MRFTPKSDEELQMMNLMHEGEYPFEVLDATPEVSKSNNEMIKLKLKVFDQEGREHVIFDYLLEALSWKLKHFCKATGLLDDYEAGVLDHLKCIGKSGYVKIIIQKGNVNPSGGHYADKNSVKDYIFAESENKPFPKPTTDFKDDELPF